MALKWYSSLKASISLKICSLVTKSILLIIKSELDVKALITNYLNTITYLNLTEGQLINHADIETLVGDKLFLLLSNNKTNNFNQIIIDILDKNKINYEIYKDDISFLTKNNFVSKQPK